uniref:F-box/WD-40 repeat-containing protein At5g21040 n=1 Tax=Anthurium amnicola TaxID=1678845 RepID=A0A1D1Y3M9_9ARAE
MAFECSKIGESSSKKSVYRAWDKQAKLIHSRHYVSGAISGSNFTVKAEKNSINVKSASGFESKEESDACCGNIVAASASDGRQSITDLPQALLSEILCRLDAKELGIVSCVSTLLHSLASDHRGWREFYCKRWGPPLGSTHCGSGLPDERAWKELFIEREFRSKSFMGRFSMDVLRGHTEAVRSVFLLPEAKLIFTGGYDSVVRMWDMEDGLSISSSRPLGCTIRAVAADTLLLVAGGTDSFLQCWRAVERHPHLFDITGSSGSLSEFRLWGHEGPVTCVALDSSRIFSGSWDMSVRVWDRAQMKCSNVLRHGDWVWSLVPRGSTVASTAGRDAYVWDIENGNQITVISNGHVGNAYSLARTHSGDLLFTGGEDGAVHLFDLMIDSDGDDIKPVATWVPHTAAVHSLAFEFPWLVSCSSDGRLALIDVRKLLGSRRCSSIGHQPKIGQAASSPMEPPQRMLHGFGCNLFTVAIGADRIVCGGEEGVVRMWNFSQALEIERRVRAIRVIRLENRMRRQKVQVDLNNKNGSSDQCAVAAKRNQTNGDRSGIWHSKRGVSGKLKA